ncbi:putative transcriptional regulator [Alcanivorax sp. S71-1-4]|uniref:LysR family transcriptional regulator n=1 Tax=Alcanivorax sp. S71-1-4 TaxID=1177159 RepID=UPI0013573BA6|nr:LysR family transcriptional regulator [Alcanivorax sp. S71-1-4]KAF0806109.1 putative transcriptional regulator [Alcanivorax sp. S71-1-4]
MFSADDDPRHFTEHDERQASVRERAPWLEFFDSRAQLDAFVQVAELASFRRAAVHLGQGVVSLRRQIGRLERQQGERLFRREGDAVRLTGAGRRLYAVARLIPGVTRTDLLAQPLSRPVTLTLDEPLAHDLLRRGLMTHLRNQPRARINLLHAMPGHALTEDTDVRVLLREPETPPLDDAFLVRRLGCLRFAPFIARRHQTRNALPLEDCLLVQYRPFAALPAFEEWNTLVRQRSVGVLEVDTSDLLRDCLTWSAAIGLLPHYSHRLDRNLLPLDTLLADTPAQDVHLLVRRDISDRVEVNAVVNMLVQAFADRREWLMD